MKLEVVLAGRGACCVFTDADGRIVRIEDSAGANVAVPTLTAADLLEVARAEHVAAETAAAQGFGPEDDTAPFSREQIDHLRSERCA